MDNINPCPTGVKTGCLELKKYQKIQKLTDFHETFRKLLSEVSVHHVGKILLINICNVAIVTIYVLKFFLSFAKLWNLIVLSLFHIQEAGFIASHEEKI